MTVAELRSASRALFERRARLVASRDLSWLDFSLRVLALAADRSIPLAERIGFVAIAEESLDEFFQVCLVPMGRRAPRGHGDAPLASEIRERILEIERGQEEVFAELRGELEAAGIRLASWEDVSERDRGALRSVFEERIFPVLTPLSVDPARPFPSVASLSLNLAVLARPSSEEEVRFAHLGVPLMLRRLIPLASGEGFVPVEEVIAAHLEILFPGTEIQAQSAFRVTRDAVGQGTGKGEAVRLEIQQSMSRRSREFLMTQLDLVDEDVYPRRDLLALGSLRELCELDRPDLKQRRSPRRPTGPQEGGV